MVERLAEIHNDLGVHGDSERADAEYLAAFRGYGVDLDALGPATAGARLAASPAAAELASALDQWAFIRRGGFLRDPAGADRLVAVAKAADPDPWRDQLRDTLAHMPADRGRALAALEKLADTADLDRLPEASVSRLAFSLARRGRSERAIALLRGIQRKHPDDFWINADLGHELDVLRPARGRRPLLRRRGGHPARTAGSPSTASAGPWIRAVRPTRRSPPSAAWSTSGPATRMRASRWGPRCWCWTTAGARRPRSAPRRGWRNPTNGGSATTSPTSGTTGAIGSRPSPSTARPSGSGPTRPRITTSWAVPCSRSAASTRPLTPTGRPSGSNPCPRTRATDWPTRCWPAASSRPRWPPPARSTPVNTARSPVARARAPPEGREVGGPGRQAPRPPPGPRPTRRRRRGRRLRPALRREAPRCDRRPPLVGSVRRRAGARGRPDGRRPIPGRPRRGDGRHGPRPRPAPARRGRPRAGAGSRSIGWRRSSPPSTAGSKRASHAVASRSSRASADGGLTPPWPASATRRRSPPSPRPNARRSAPSGRAPMPSSSGQERGAAPPARPLRGCETIDSGSRMPNSEWDKVGDSRGVRIRNPESSV